MDNTYAHNKLKNEALLFLSSTGEFMPWGNATGTARAMSSNHVIKYGLVGSADIFAIRRGGKFYAIEVKTGKGGLSPQQRTFRDRVRELGAVFIECRSIEQLEKEIYGD